MLGVDFINVLFNIAHNHGLLFLIEVDEFEDIGVVDGCPFDEETVVISEFFLAVGL
jgi:hypothetical protein